MSTTIPTAAAVSTRRTSVRQWLAGDPVELHRAPDAVPKQPAVVSVDLADGQRLSFVAADLVAALLYVAGLDVPAPLDAVAEAMNR